MFYGYFIGIDSQSLAPCLVCPHVTLANTHPISTFARLTLAMGALNALVFSALGCLLQILVVRMRKVRRERLGGLKLEQL
jgi:hypothetical protein